MKRPGLGATMVLFGILTAGCADSDHADLEAFVAQTAQKYRPVPSSGADASPPTARREPFAYSAGELRSPFQPPSALGPTSNAGQPLVAPDFGRAKEHLERFPLAQLRLVGSLSGRNTRRALVRDPDGVVHPVGVGAHIGTDFGRIRAIADDGIELIEIVRDAGGWVERARFIALNHEKEDE